MWVTNSIASLLLCTLAVSGFSVLIHFLVRKHIPQLKVGGSNDVAVGVYATISVVYAVVIGLLVIIGQERRDAAGSSIVLETAVLDDITHASFEFDAPTTYALHRSVVNYTTTVINNEWKLLSTDREEQITSEPYEQLWKDILRTEVRNEHQAIVYSSMMDRLQDLSEARYSRINAASEHLTTFFWIVLLTGGTILIVFPWMFSVSSTTVHIVMTGITSSIVTLVLLLVLLYDNPLSGVGALDQEPYLALLSDIRAELKP